MNRQIIDNSKKNKITGLVIALMLSIFGCNVKSTAANPVADFEGFEFLETDKDFSKKRSPGSQEAAYEYRNFFLPSVDGVSQPYVGDCMPYYENGTYYIYYLKDRGDSYNHSIYLATTSDFVTYTEQQAPVLEASKIGMDQDNWIGTGSVVKIDNEYYFFYTGHASVKLDCQEKIMVAKSDNLTSFTKVAGWSIAPDDLLGQKQDFRDPQAYFDSNSNKIIMTVTASKDGKPRILKYSMDKNLNNVIYEGIIFTDELTNCYNLECSDTFELNGKYYLTYSAQDDTLWYAVSNTPYGNYKNPARLDGKIFYAPKHVKGENDYYMVGWGRRAGSPSSAAVDAWAGNLVVHKLLQKQDGSLILAPVNAVENQFVNKRKIASSTGEYEMNCGSLYGFQEMFMAYESFLISGDFKYSGKGKFGLAFDYDGDEENYKMITVDPKNKKITLSFKGGKSEITEKAVSLHPNRQYSFKYIQEGSMGIFYINDVAALTVRLYGVSGKAVRLFAENSKVKFSNLAEFTR